MGFFCNAFEWEKMMLQVKRLYSFLASTALLCLCGFFSCTMHVMEEKSHVEYGSLEVSGGDSSRALSVASISYAKVSVTGSGISSPIQSDFLAIKGGIGSVSLERIPTGANRVVTVQGYTSASDDAAVTGALIRAVTDIKAGPNSCSVSKTTTALANVFVKLQALGADLGSVNKEKISSVLPSKSWSLIDTDKIAADYVSDSTLSGKSSSDYQLTTGSVNFTSSLTNSYTIQITDPSSQVFNMSSSYVSKTVSDAAPGTWGLLVLDSKGKVVASDNNLKVVSGETTSVSVNESIGGKYYR